jgi:hypothetical protein
VLVLGVVSQIGQVLFIRELLMAFQGSELSIGLILAGLDRCRQLFRSLFGRAGQPAFAAAVSQRSWERDNASSFHAADTGITGVLQRSTPARTLRYLR